MEPGVPRAPGCPLSPRALLGAGVAVLVAGALAARLLVVPRVEAWTLVGADADGAIVWTELAVANTGLLRDQLTTRLLVLPGAASAIEHRAQWGSATVGDGGIVATPDQLAATPEGWELRVGGGGLAARIRASGAAAGCPPTPGELGGMVEDRIEGRLVTGPGLVMRTRTEGHAVGTAVYVVADGFAAAVDPFAACPAWVRGGDEAWTGDAAPFDLARVSALTLGAWTFTFRSAGDAVVHDGWAHALGVERAAAALLGYAPPVTEARRVVVRVEGPGGPRIAPGFVLVRR